MISHQRYKNISPAVQFDFYLRKLSLFNCSMRVELVKA